jgi:hypothetical protein
MAVVAQASASIADAAAERSGWLTPLERAQPDVGFSSISAAWFTNALLHRVERASGHTRRWWQAGTVAFAGAMTAGAYSVDSLGGKLDITSHAAGILVGAGAYVIEKRRNEDTKTPLLDAS